MTMFRFLMTKQFVNPFALFAGGGGSLAAIDLIDIYIISLDAVSSGTTLTRSGWSICGTSNNEKSLFAGGTTGAGAVNFTDKYLHANKSVSSGGNLTAANSAQGGGSGSEKAIFGGGDTTASGTMTNTTNEYTYSSDTHASGQAIGVARSQIQGFGSGTIVYFSGGNPNPGYSNRTDKYIISTSTVSGNTSITGRWGGGASSTKTHGYIGAGRTSAQPSAATSLEKYRFSDDSISSGQTLSTARWVCGAAGNNVKAIFGKGFSSVDVRLSSTERYLYANDTVSAGTSFASSGAAHSVCASSSSPGHL